MGKTYELEISGRLPSLNEYISANRYDKNAGNRFKRNEQKKVMWQIRQQLKGVKIRRPIRLHYIWYERDRRRDLDNISGFGHKVIQDALVECGVLKDDGWDEIVGYSDTFAVDRGNPRIIVLLEVI